MSDLSDTIKSFYSDFILRDLLSFVTPGAIVVGALMFILSNCWLRSWYGHPDFLLLINLIPIFGWILVFGFFYIVGIGLQYVRECIPSLKFPPLIYRSKYRDSNLKINPDEKNGSKPVDENNQFKREFGCDELFRNSKYYAEFRLPFMEKTRSFEEERKTEERYVIIMQASGNSGIAFFIATFFVLVSFIFHQFLLLLLGIAVCFLIVAIILILNFKIHRQRLLDWELEVSHHHILSSRSFSRSHFRRRL